MPNSASPDAIISVPSTAHNTPPTTETQAPRPRRLITFYQAARHRGVHERTIRNYVGKGYFPAYKMRGVRSAVVDLDEMDEALAKLPRHLIKTGGSYGPKAQIIEIPPQAIITDDRLGGNR